MIHRLVYGGGAQTLRHVPAATNGRAAVVASATYSIVDLRRSTTDTARTIQASTAATVDAVSTTISAAAGPSTADARKLTLTSATGVTAGKRYLLTHATTGASEPVRVVEVTGSVLLLADPVAAAFPSGATFKGLEVTGTFPSATANDETLFDNGGGPYLVAWVYSAGGETITREEVIFVERAREHCPATEADLREHHPEIGSAIVGGKTSIASYLAAAWRAMRADLTSRGVELQDLKSDVATAAVCYLAAARLYRFSGTAASDRGEEWADLADRAQAAYRDLLGAMTRGLARPSTVEINRRDATAQPGTSTTARGRFLQR